MNIKKFLPTMVALLLVCLYVPALRADLLSASLVNDTLSGTAGSSVTFQASASNPSSTDTLFLLADNSLTSSVLLTVDDSPFINNWPISLLPNASFGPADLFTVNILSGLTPGTYTGTFSILGNTDGSDTLVDLADLSFTVDVIPSIPEPGPLQLLLVAAPFAGALLLLKVRSA